MDEVSAARAVFNFSDSVVGVFKIFPDGAHNSKLADWIEVLETHRSVGFYLFWNN